MSAGTSAVLKIFKICLEKTMPLIQTNLILYFKSEFQKRCRYWILSLWEGTKFFRLSEISAKNRNKRRWQPDFP